MIKAVIIDDEPLARQIVKEYLQAYPQIILIQECNDGFEGLKAIMQHQPGIIFLDIQMPKINGFEMLELLENKPAIIFTTAFDEFAIQAFEANAVDYLLKPFSKERFDRALEKYMGQGSLEKQKDGIEKMLQSVTNLPSLSERIVLKTSGNIRIIPIHDIQYIEAADDYVKIHTAEGSFLKNKTMSFFEKTLPGNLFVRTHRSYIINVQEITRIDPFEKENHIAILRSGARVALSKNGYGILKRVLGF